MASQAHLGVCENEGCLIGAPVIRESDYWGTILGVPSFRKSPTYLGWDQLGGPPDVPQSLGSGFRVYFRAGNLKFLYPKL